MTTIIPLASQYDPAYAHILRTPDSLSGSEIFDAFNFDPQSEYSDSRVPWRLARHFDTLQIVEGSGSPPIEYANLPMELHMQGIMSTDEKS